jgi:hypothetical protein
MTRLIRAELYKLTTLRTFWWTAFAALAFVPISIGTSLHGTPNDVGLDTTEGFRGVIASASSGAGIVLLLGILLMAGEFRFNTITSTLLITPDRKRVIAAKLAASSLAGLAIGIAASVLTLAIALPWLASRGVHSSGHVRDIAVAIGGALLSTTIYGLVGVGFGALVTNQTLAITTALMWSLAVEALVVGIRPGIGQWLPGGAANALASVSTPKGGLLPFWAGGLLFAGYGLAFAYAGSLRLANRDIT